MDGLTTVDPWPATDTPLPPRLRPDPSKGCRSRGVYQTGDTTDGRDFDGRRSRFVATPILVDDKLVFSTGFNRVIALEPATGEELWSYDPEVAFARPYSEMFTSRGVAAWLDSGAGEAACRARVFLGTLDARLIAIDAATGLACADFGKRGQVDLSKGIRRFRKRDYSVTSPPTVVGDLVIVGSAIGDKRCGESRARRRARLRRPHRVARLVLGSAAARRRSSRRRQLDEAAEQPHRRRERVGCDVGGS